MFAFIAFVTYKYHMCYMYAWYMQTFKVVVENHPDDVAYTGNALPYHSDLSGWSEYPPGLQILHCIVSVNYLDNDA